MVTPCGKNSRAASAADPCHTPSIRVGDPPTEAINGTVVSITTVPDFLPLFTDFNLAPGPEKGTVTLATARIIRRTPSLFFSLHHYILTSLLLSSPRYTIPANRNHADSPSYPSRVSHRMRPVRHRRHCAHRRTRSRQSSRHDREFAHLSL